MQEEASRGLYHLATLQGTKLSTICAPDILKDGIWENVAHVRMRGRRGSGLGLSPRGHSYTNAMSSAGS